MWNQPYWVYLAGISFFFFVVERLRPWRREQRVLRPGFVTDIAHLVFNGVILALLLAPVANLITPYVDQIVIPTLGRGHVARWPLWAQFLVAFFAIDFIKWGVHVVLHHVSFLWKFHQVHHSILDMDWAGNMRFHWLEIVVYNGTLYVPMLLLGFDWRVLLIMAIVSTAIGHFNHSNFAISLGPLKYVFNHPGMHIWHHEHEIRYRAGCNFGINLSIWDWLFGTAYYPDPAGLEQPKALGFRGIESFPKNFATQQLYPFSLLFGRSTRN